MTEASHANLKLKTYPIPSRYTPFTKINCLNYSNRIKLLKLKSPNNTNNSNKLNSNWQNVPPTLNKKSNCLPRLIAN